MSWASRRQLSIILVLISILIIVGSVIIVPTFFKAPTCTDGKQNGNEEGVDCGGICAKLCLSKINDLKVLWSRSFKSSDGIYDSIAYVENQNFDTGIKKIVYKFSLYDTDNVLVTERVGKTYITPNGRFAIFEGGIKTGSRIPKRTFFEFAEEPDWIKVPQKAALFLLGTNDIRLDDATTSPKLSVSIKNKSIYDVSNVDVTAILYDDKDNAFATSHTIMDALSKDSSSKIFFTWLIPFAFNPSRIEVIPRVDIFSIDF